MKFPVCFLPLAVFDCLGGCTKLQDGFLDASPRQSQCGKFQTIAKCSWVSSLHGSCQQQCTIRWPLCKNASAANVHWFHPKFVPNGGHIVSIWGGFRLVLYQIPVFCAGFVGRWASIHCTPGLVYWTHQKCCCAVWLPVEQARGGFRQEKDRILVIASSFLIPAVSSKNVKPSSHLEGKRKGHQVNLLVSRRCRPD